MAPKVIKSAHGKTPTLLKQLADRKPMSNGIVATATLKSVGAFLANSPKDVFHRHMHNVVRSDLPLACVSDIVFWYRSTRQSLYRSRASSFNHDSIIAVDANGVVQPSVIL